MLEKRKGTSLNYDERNSAPIGRRRTPAFGGISAGFRERESIRIVRLSQRKGAKKAEKVLRRRTTTATKGDLDVKFLIDRACEEKKVAKKRSRLVYAQRMRACRSVGK